MKSNSKKRYIEGFLSGIIITVMVFAGAFFALYFTGVVPVTLPGNGQSKKEQEAVDQKVNVLKQYIDKYYMDPYKEANLEDGIYKGMISGLGDQYSTYFSAQEYKETSQASAGSYCGVGITVSQNQKTGDIYVVQAHKGGSAQKEGVRPGDIIYKVNGKKVSGEDLTKVAAMMKGEAGTTVKMEMIRKGVNKAIPFSLVRKKLEIVSVDYKMYPNQIGYIHVNSFEGATVKQFKHAMQSLERQGEKGLIIDLRDNGGGLLSSAVSMLKQILPKGLIVYTKEKSGKAEEYYCDGKHEFQKPIVILVNGNTASASEVFSGAVKDYNKGILMGTKTFGKGIVQTVFPLSDGSAIKLTTAKYYSPKGRNIQGKGFEPDIEVPYKADAKTDNQIMAARKYLLQKQGGNQK